MDITPLPLCCFIILHLLFNPNLEYSEAKCLGAKTVCRKAFQYSQSTEQAIISELVTDQQALHAVETFLGKSSVCWLLLHEGRLGLGLPRGIKKAELGK